MKYSTLLSIGPCGSGRTYRVAKACKRINGTLVCSSDREAYQLSKKFGVKTCSLSESQVGRSGPFLVDHNAMLQICLEYESHIELLREQLQEANQGKAVWEASEGSKSGP